MTAALTSEDAAPSFRDLVAAELRAHLARRRISNRRLARMLGTTPAWIDRRVNGTTAVSTDDLELIAQALGMTPMDLIQGVTAARPNSSTTARNFGRSSDSNAAVVIQFPQVNSTASSHAATAATASVRSQPHELSVAS